MNRKLIARRDRPAGRFPSVFGAVLLVVTGTVFAADLRVMKSGLGSGTVVSTPAGINCGSVCDAPFASSVTVELTATADTGSVFAGWAVDPDADAGTTPDCTGTGTCTGLAMNVERAVRPVFTLAPGTIPPLPRPTAGTTMLAYPPGVIATYLTANTNVDSVAEFISALPDEFRQNWLLMSRSESLQTGTAEFPRILLASGDIKAVFTLSLDATTHSGYPGAHRDAIEYMQWDETEKNFRFHEIVLKEIAQLDHDGDGVGEIPLRPRGVYEDEERCSRCHSTRNVKNTGTTAGTDDAVKVKNKPNWDTYDSWGGMLPFNRDRVYHGSVEAAAVRRILNPWSWANNNVVRSIIEQLRLQPPGTAATHRITRLQGGVNDGHVKFRFDPATPVTIEPAPEEIATTTVAYNFDRTVDATGTDVHRDGQFVTLQNPQTLAGDEGRGVDFFDILSGQLGDLNGTRIADELIDHTFATGSRPIDVRPIVLAVTNVGQCIEIDSTNNVVKSKAGLNPLSASALTFFDARHGMSINELVEDTRERAESLTIRKTDIQKLNLDRTGDEYLDSGDTSTGGLIQQYGAATSQGTSVSKERLRQEVFRRRPSASQADATIMDGKYVDRELYSTFIDRTALYRYFLEPLGVSVDKWSMGVRGRSRTYTFADVFSRTRAAIDDDLVDSFDSKPYPGLGDPSDCADLIDAVNDVFTKLPAATDPPKYTDVQRIFNKGCIECHGDLDYPPYANYGNSLNLAEDDSPPAGNDRLDRSHGIAASRSLLFQRITGNFTLVNPTDFDDTNPYGPTIDESCPNFSGLMPCGGPPLSQADILTIRRWILAGRPNSRGDPHIKTVNGVNYDFQAAGEFVLMKGPNFEVQVRQTGVETNGPLGPNAHTGLTSCVSINTAVAVRSGSNRITYQPDLDGEGQLELRVNGELAQLGANGIALTGGGRIMPASAAGGVRVEVPGGGFLAMTPSFWSHYQVWYINVDANRLRASDGLMGTIPNGEWLPALPDGKWLGPRPKNVEDRYKQLYGVFGGAWQVTADSSLFDYAPGTTTATFTYELWPNGESPASCSLPPQPGIAPVPAPAPMTQAMAEQQCADVLQDDAKKNCIDDVMVTGAPEFAAGYVLSEAIELNVEPPAPEVIRPADGADALSLPIDFEWGTTSDDDDDQVTYRHCIWEVGTVPDDNDCETVATTTTSDADPLKCALWVLIITAIVIVILILRGRRNVVLLSVVAVLGLLLAVAAYLYCSRAAPESLTTKAANLKPDTAYYWKVIVEDGRGGISESRTQYLRTQ